MSVQESIAPGVLLHQEFISRVTRNPRYSLRAFARDLEVSHAFLSMVLHGKKRIASPRLLQFGQHLGWNTALTLRLIHDGEKNHLSGKLKAIPQSLSRRKKMPRQRLVLELERFRVLSEWHHLAILDLLAVKGFRPDETWIGRVLGVSRRKVQIAVRRLERLGLLEKGKFGWRKTTAHLVVPGIKPYHPLRRLHRSLIEKADRYLAEVGAKDYQRYDCSGAILAIDCSRLPEAKRRIARFRRRLAAFLTEGEATGLYQLGVQLLPLAELEIKRQRRTK